MSSLQGAALHLDRVGVDLGGRSLVDNISLTASPGQMVALVGPNGAGKTTLVRAIAGLVRRRGSISIAGRDLDAIASRERARLLAYMPQTGTLAWPMRVRDVVAIGRLPHEGSGRRAENERCVNAALAACGIADLADAITDRLSGGERVRVMLARTLAVDAPIVLLDEPVASLDPAQQLAVMDLLRAQADAGKVIVVVMHDLALAVRYASRAVILDRGRMIADASPTELLHSGDLGRVFGLNIEAVQTAGGWSLYPTRDRSLPSTS